jgi:hypothetical protein
MPAWGATKSENAAVRIKDESGYSTADNFRKNLIWMQTKIRRDELLYGIKTAL